MPLYDDHWQPGDHIGYIYKTDAAWEEVIPWFVSQGLARREKVILVGGVEAALQDAGIDVDAARQQGQLLLLNTEVYTPGGVFDPETMTAWLRHQTELALEEGYTAMRITSDMGWALQHFTEFDQLIRYEAQLSHFFAEAPCLALCQYDQRRFPAEVLLDVLRTHPHVIIETEACDNVYYVPPEDLLSPRHTEAALERHLTSLTTMRRALLRARQSAAEVTSLLEGARAVLEYREFEDSARAIFDICKRLTGATSGYVALLSEDGAENELLFLDAGGLPCTVNPELPMPIRGLRSEAYRLGQAVYDNEFASSPWMQYMPGGHCPLDQVMFAPLPIEGKVVGLIGLANKPGGFNDNDARLVTILGELAAIALLNSRTLEALQASEAQLRAYTGELEQRVEEKVRELEQARAKVVHAGKLASLGEMATGIAHEVNQPLTSILFDATYLRRLCAPDAAPQPLPREEIHDIAQAIEEDVNRVQRITQHLRSFGRIAGGHITTVNLNQPIRDSLILVQERLRLHDVTLTLDLAPDLPPIQADPHKLEQVFINLISNAEYALERRDELAQDEHRKTLELSTRIEGDAVIAQVRDNGCGISEEAMKRLYEPFFTTKPVGEGTGLGLSISYGIVAELNGELRCESQEGEGTTFTLRFPLAEMSS